MTGRDRGDVARRAGVFAGAAALLALPSLVALGSGLPEFVDAGGFSTAFKEHFPAGQPGEALGLVPRVWAIEEDWPAAIRVTWLVAASLLAVVLLVGGMRAARRLGRADFVLAGSALVLGGWVVLLLPAFAPYLSYKLLAYGAPFLVLLVLAPFAGRRTRATVAAAARRRRPARGVGPRRDDRAGGRAADARARRRRPGRGHGLVHDRRRLGGGMGDLPPAGRAPLGGDADVPPHRAGPEARRRRRTATARSRTTPSCAATGSSSRRRPASCGEGPRRAPRRRAG